MNPRQSSNELTGFAESLVIFGKKHGADEIEVSIADGIEFSIDIRQGKIENLVEAGSRYMSVKVIKDQKTAFSSSSDLSKDTLQRLIKNAIKRAAYANPDKNSGLPPYRESNIDIPALELFDTEMQELETKKKIELALQTEKIALQDKRITNSHGASFETREIKTILANSNGFLSDYQETFCGLGLGLQGGETDNKVEGSWSCSKRHFSEMEDPEEIAKKAVQRTTRQLNPRKIKTQNVPVIFEPPMTSWLLGFLSSCVSGVSIYHKASFLVDKLGQRIGNDKINIFDDGLMPGKLGTRPFDSEGVPTQKTTVVEKGMLKNYLCNTYAARKLNLTSTGNAEGNSTGVNNFYLQAGNTPSQKIINSLDKGLILIRTIGHGLNPITGDISRGAFGLWVEKGEIVYPVSEITISGNLGTILNEIEFVGSDLEFRSSVAGPTIQVKELMVAGE